MRGPEEDFEYQGKRKNQVEFSEKMAGGSALIMIIIFLVFIHKKNIILLNQI